MCNDKSSLRRCRAGVHVIVSALLLIVASTLALLVLSPAWLNTPGDEVRVSPLVIEQVIPGYLVVRNVGTSPVWVDTLYILDPHDNVLEGVFTIERQEIPPGGLLEIPIPPHLLGVLRYGE